MGLRFGVYRFFVVFLILGELLELSSELPFVSDDSDSESLETDGSLGDSRLDVGRRDTRLVPPEEVPAEIVGFLSGRGPVSDNFRRWKGFVQGDGFEGVVVRGGGSRCSSGATGSRGSVSGRCLPRRELVAGVGGESMSLDGVVDEVLLRGRNGLLDLKRGDIAGGGVGWGSGLGATFSKSSEELSYLFFVFESECDDGEDH